MSPYQIDSNPIHLGLGGSAAAQPKFTGMEWYEAYGERTASDGVDGRLVSMYTFTEPWDMWEMHPSGHEVVLCTAGEVTLHQEHTDGSSGEVTLTAGEYTINPPGTWHTADVATTATCVFITAGLDTQHRPR